MNTPETPAYVLGAVRALVERGESRYLEEQFKNGIQLHQYPESRELVLTLLRGEKPRSRGGQHKTESERIRDFSIALRVAEYKEMGFAVINNGLSDKPDACSIVGEIYGMSGSHVRGCWNKYKDDPYVIQAMDIVKKDPRSFLNLLDPDLMAFVSKE